MTENGTLNKKMGHESKLINLNKTTAETLAELIRVHGKHRLLKVINHRGNIL